MPSQGRSDGQGFVVDYPSVRPRRLTSSHSSDKPTVKSKSSDRPEYFQLGMLGRRLIVMRKFTRSTHCLDRVV